MGKTMTGVKTRRADGLVPGESFWVVQLFDGMGYYASVKAHKLEKMRELAQIRTNKLKSLVATSIPFLGYWFTNEIPDVSLPESFQESLVMVNKGVDYD
jgi:hypothetical protein